MIRKFLAADVDEVAEIWLDTNISAHDFIPAQYWKDNFEAVREMFLQAEIYVCEDEENGKIQGFIGLSGSYIAGIFVCSKVQSKGIGKQLLNFVKRRKTELSLNVYQKNVRAVKFYQRENFRIDGEEIDRNTEEKEYVMIWDMRPGLIRDIQTDDATAIKHICESALGHKTTVDLIERQIKKLSSDPGYYIAVFENEMDHTVKGFIQAEKYDLLYGGNGWNIIALAVASDAQKNGIGKHLLLSLEKYAEEKGDTFVRLNCRNERIDAHAFYEHLGYQCDKIQKRFIKYIGSK